jgi:hypothetical protein
VPLQWKARKEMRRVEEMRIVGEPRMEGASGCAGKGSVVHGRKR